MKTIEGGVAPLAAGALPAHDSDMRASIIAWSTFSGFLLALFAAALTIAVVAMIAVLFPDSMGRLIARWRAIGLIVLLVVVPLLGAIAGFLEGRLKAE